MVELLVVDLDHTLFDATHRQAFAVAKEWDEFHSRMIDDNIHSEVEDVIDALTDHGVDLIFMTTRPEKFRKQTQEQLEQWGYDESDYRSLLMRPKENNQPSYKLKVEMFLEEILDSSSETRKAMKSFKTLYREEDQEEFLEDLKEGTLFLDDRDSVVEALRGQGFKCWQVRSTVF